MKYPGSLYSQTTRLHVTDITVAAPNISELQESKLRWNSRFLKNLVVVVRRSRILVNKVLFSFSTSLRTFHYSTNWKVTPRTVCVLLNALRIPCQCCLITLEKIHSNFGGKSVNYIDSWKAFGILRETVIESIKEKEKENNNYRRKHCDNKLKGHKDKDLLLKHYSSIHWIVRIELHLNYY